MALLSVDNKDIYYLDSGPIQNETYVTLFVLHGHTFYSPIFKRLFPLAPKYNIRIVALTRRDYSGSTLYTPPEIDVITHGDTTAKTGFLQARALEIALFLEKFTQENSLPKTSPDGNQGGIALLGWSLGNVHALSVVGLAQHFPKGLQDSLDPYFRRLVLYECPYHSLGFPEPQKAYHPRRDPSIPRADQNARFNAWVSGYFNHPAFVSGSHVLEYSTPSQDRRPTTTAMTPEELAAVTDTAPGPRSEDPFFVGADPRMMGCIRDEVFFPGTKVWLKLSVNSVWGMQTTWSIPYGAWELERYIEEEANEQGSKKWQRPLDFFQMEGTNHFAHWDDPKKLMQVFADALSY